jgi:hypothetical protein
MISVVLHNDPWKARISVKSPVVFSSGRMALCFMVVWSDHHQQQFLPRLGSLSQLSDLNTDQLKATNLYSASDSAANRPTDSPSSSDSVVHS